MANITTTGTTGYPGVIDTRTALTDGAAGDLIVANHPNGLGAAVLAIETELGTDPAGTVADVKTRLDVSQNNDGTIKSTVIGAGPGAAVTYASGVFTIAFSGDGPNFTQNIALRIDVNAPVANQMRINLLQADLSTPTTTAPVRIAFAAATPSSGIYNLRSATTTTTLVVTGGSTLGMLAGEIGRIYIGAVDNSSVPELCVWNPKVVVASSTAPRVYQLYRPSEVELQTTTAEGGAGGADSAATVYSGTARTNVPIRILGYIDIQAGSTAGNWSNNPNALHLVGPGVKTTGEVVQAVSTVTNVVRTGTDVTVNDGTTPQIDEGDPYLWATMTTTNLSNPIRVSALANLATTAAGSRMQAHLHRNSEVDAVLSSVAWHDAANAMQPTIVDGMLATTTSGATGYYLICGANLAGTTTLNGEAGGARLGPSIVTYLTIEEVAA